MGPVPELAEPAVWSLAVLVWAAALMRSVVARPTAPDQPPEVAPVVGPLLAGAVRTKLGLAAVPEAPLLWSRARTVAVSRPQCIPAASPTKCQVPLQTPVAAESLSHSKSPVGRVVLRQQVVVGPLQPSGVARPNTNMLVVAPAPEVELSKVAAVLPEPQ